MLTRTVAMVATVIALVEPAAEMVLMEAQLRKIPSHCTNYLQLVVVRPCWEGAWWRHSWKPSNGGAREVTCHSQGHLWF